MKKVIVADTMLAFLSTAGAPLMMARAKGAVAEAFEEKGAEETPKKAAPCGVAVPRRR